MFTKRRLAHAQGYLELGMLDAAEAELARIPATEASEPGVLAVRLAVLHEKQDWPAVRDLARDLAERQPNDPALWVTWAYATRRCESLEAAEKILLAAEKHHPAEATIQFNLGCYACQRGDLEAARRRVDRAISLDAKFKTVAATDPDLAPLRARQSATDCPPGA